MITLSEYSKTHPIDRQPNQVYKGSPGPSNRSNEISLNEVICNLQGSGLGLLQEAITLLGALLVMTEILHDGWYVVIKAYKFTLFVIHCMSVPSLHIESTDCAIPVLVQLWLYPRLNTCLKVFGFCHLKPSLPDLILPTTPSV